MSKDTTGEAFATKYIGKLNMLNNNWSKSYKIAKLHNDTEKVVIEELKLNTLQSIITLFKEMEN